MKKNKIEENRVLINKMLNILDWCKALSEQEGEHKEFFTDLYDMLATSGVGWGELLELIEEDFTDMEGFKSYAVDAYEGFQDR